MTSRPRLTQPEMWDTDPLVSYSPHGEILETSDSYYAYSVSLWNRERLRHTTITQAREIGGARVDIGTAHDSTGCWRCQTVRIPHSNYMQDVSLWDDRIITLSEYAAHIEYTFPKRMAGSIGESAIAMPGLLMSDDLLLHTILNNRAKFKRLADEWQKETVYLSSPRAIARHPAYQAIIAMERKALPLILSDLAKTHKQWFIALRTITGVDPVKKEHSRNVKAMANAWISWGRDNGYI